MTTTANISISKIESFKTLRDIGSFDKANRWYPDAAIQDFFAAIREPSRAWPHSYSRAAMTVKFAKYLRANHAALADKLNIAK